MRARRSIAIFGMCGVLLLLALPAAAQLTTGSVGGTVKDAQGGVVPGATVTLISDTRGTRSIPVTTDANGDFVFPNLTADTYTIEIGMTSFKPLRQSGTAVRRASGSSAILEQGAPAIPIASSTPLPSRGRWLAASGWSPATITCTGVSRA